MLQLMVVCLISAFTSGIFLNMNIVSVQPAVFAGLVTGGALSFLFPELFWGIAFMTGMLVFSLVALILEKRNLSDSLFVLCIGGCQLGLWTTCFSGLYEFAEGIIVLFLYCSFFLLHIPAILLSFEKFRLQEDWRLKTKGLHRTWISVIGLLLPLLILAISSLSGKDKWTSLIKLFIMTTIVWMGLSIMVLLVTCVHTQVKNTAEGTYHEEMNTFMNVVRSQRHDYNLHVQTVASLIVQEKWEECRSYVNAIVQDTNQMNEVLPVKDPAVAGLIHNYRILAEQGGHHLFLDIRDDMSDLATSAYETNKIIGNLLQNALDEVARHDRPEEIELTIIKRGEYCLVKVSNRVKDATLFSGQGEEVFRQGFTTKTGHDGVGLSSIRALVRKLGGDVTVWLEDDMVHFVASIPKHLVFD